MHKSAVKFECVDPALIPTTWTISWIVTLWSSMTIHRIFSIDSFFNLFSSACLAQHWSVAMFEAVVLLVDLRFVHGIIDNGLVNLLDGLSLGINKLMAKLDAISLQDAYDHFAGKRKSDECALHVYSLGITTWNWDGLLARKVSFMCRIVEHHLTPNGFCPRDICFVGKVGYFLNVSRILKKQCLKMLSIWSQSKKHKANFARIDSFYGICFLQIWRHWSNWTQSFRIFGQIFERWIQMDQNFKSQTFSLLTLYNVFFFSFDNLKNINS